MQGSLVATIPDVDRHPLLDESLDIIGPVLLGSEQEGSGGGRLKPCFLSSATAASASKRGGPESRLSSIIAAVFTEAMVGQFVEVSAGADQKFVKL